MNCYGQLVTDQFDTEQVTNICVQNSGAPLTIYIYVNDILTTSNLLSTADNTFDCCTVPTPTPTATPQPVTPTPSAALTFNSYANFDNNGGYSGDSFLYSENTLNQISYLSTFDYTADNWSVSCWNRPMYDTLNSGSAPRHHQMWGISSMSQTNPPYPMDGGNTVLSSLSGNTLTLYHESIGAPTYTSRIVLLMVVGGNFYEWEWKLNDTSYQPENSFITGIGSQETWSIPANGNTNQIDGMTNLVVTYKANETAINRPTLYWNGAALTLTNFSNSPTGPNNPSLSDDHVYLGYGWVKYPGAHPNEQRLDDVLFYPGTQLLGTDAFNIYGNGNIGPTYPTQYNYLYWSFESGVTQWTDTRPDGLGAAMNIHENTRTTQQNY